MDKRVCVLLALLIIVCGLFAALPAAYAAGKPLTPAITDVKVTKSGEKLSITWQYHGTETDKVTVALYQNGKFVRTLAENVPIGKAGKGITVADWDHSNGKTAERQRSYGIGDTPRQRGYGIGDTPYQVEIVSMTDSKLRGMSDTFSRPIVSEKKGREMLHASPVAEFSNGYLSKGQLADNQLLEYRAGKPAFFRGASVSEFANGYVRKGQLASAISLEYAPNQYKSFPAGSVVQFNSSGYVTS